MADPGTQLVEGGITERFGIQTQLGPLNIKLFSTYTVMHDLTLDLVRGVPTTSKLDEPKVEGEILFEKQLVTLSPPQPRALVSGYILGLLRGYPEIAAQQEKGGETQAKKPPEPPPPVVVDRPANVIVEAPERVVMEKPAKVIVGGRLGEPGA